MATDNILEAVERLETATATLERILYGDPPARPHGLLVEFEKLHQDVAAIKADVQRIQSKRPDVWMWTLGYFCFWLAEGFGVAMLINQVDGHRLWSLPWEVAGWLAMLFAAGALFLFLGGFGWMDHG